MGCGSSKNKINQGATPRAPGEKPPVTSASSRRSKRPNSKTINVKARPKEDIDENAKPRSGKKKSRRGDKNRQWGSQDSLDSTASRDDRGWSASSKFSTHSGDSGFGGGCGGDMENIITEESHPDTIKEIEEEFNTPRGLELGITGNAMRGSASNKDRLAEQRVMAALRDEGFIQRPMSRAANGLSFEIVAAGEPGATGAGTGGEYMFLGAPARRPARLEKLERRRKKKRAPRTEEEIQAKLERAEQRRKDAERQRLAKIASLNKSDVLTALDSFATAQKEKEEVVETKLDQAAENREKRLKELRDKLKAKQEHAERVRKRKKMNPAITEESPRDATPVPVQRITEDTPVGGGGASIATSVKADRFRDEPDDRPVGISGGY